MNRSNNEIGDKYKTVDVIFDPVGGDVFETVARTMARNGRLLVIGFASGTIPKLAVNLALVKEFSVVGVFWGAFARGEPEEYKEIILLGTSKPGLQLLMRLSGLNILGNFACCTDLLKPEILWV